MKLEFEQKQYLIYLVMNDIVNHQSHINREKESIAYFSHENDLDMSEIVEHTKNTLMKDLLELDFKNQVLNYLKDIELLSRAV